MSESEVLTVRGLSRDSATKCLLVGLSRRPTDDEIRYLDGYLREWRLPRPAEAAAREALDDLLFCLAQWEIDEDTGGRSLTGAESELLACWQENVTLLRSLISASAQHDPLVTDEMAQAAFDALAPLLNEGSEPNIEDWKRVLSAALSTPGQPDPLAEEMAKALESAIDALENARPIFKDYEKDYAAAHDGAIADGYAALLAYRENRK